MTQPTHLHPTPNPFPFSRTISLATNKKTHQINQTQSGKDPTIVIIVTFINITGNPAYFPPLPVRSSILLNKKLANKFAIDNRTTCTVDAILDMLSGNCIVELNLRYYI